MSDKPEPLVSIVIPTHNSSSTLAKCLQSIEGQDYPNLEVVIVDSNSQDDTKSIAEHFGATFKTIRGKLLEARYVGLLETRGSLILLLDSDQVLEKSAIRRAVHLIGKYDMLCLEERAYECRNWLQRLFDADRHLVHSLRRCQLDPLEGTLMARFYRRDILCKAFRAIPEKLMPLVVAHDHAILYYEACRISHMVGILPRAVSHIEPTSLIDLWRKNYRYGKSTRDLEKTGYYIELIRRKTRFRKGGFTKKTFSYWIQSSLLLVLKGLAYQAGYRLGEFINPTNYI
ncbi:glycosyltransferase family 2 protein [Candidatus Bathyarchaeota archaeon]|nr:glycosyltransferase family 2 protein [Candidatus Bathyarchaeota archaeon]